MISKKPELLAPAGSFEKLKMAVHYGADAVYLGNPKFSLRSMSSSFETNEEIEAAINYAHENGVRVYVTVNIFPKNRDIQEIREHIRFLKTISPDGIIVSDPGIFLIAKSEADNIPLHISTQANVSNIEAVKFWEKLGAKRINLARELTLEEIKQIRTQTTIELEIFVHGAICISYSGRCYISAFLVNRSANSGECTNSCRWNFALVEESRKGEFFPVYENERGSYLMNSRDLCLVEYIPLFIKAGIDSLKIEGRMKGVNYVAGVVHTYRRAIDTAFKGENYNGKAFKNELLAFSSRGYTEGMLFGQQPREGFNYEGRQDFMTQRVVGIVREVQANKALIELKSKVENGDYVCFLAPEIEKNFYKIELLRDMEGNIIDKAKAGEFIYIDVPSQVRVLDVVRTPIENED